MKAKMIIVYDTIPEECKTTAETIREYYDRQNECAEIKVFTESHAFLCEFRDNYYDMAFLAMNSPLDLNTARGAGQMDLACPLFFVSRGGEYSLEGYHLSIMDYLLKPVTYERLCEAVSRIDSPFGKQRKRQRLG